MLVVALIGLLTAIVYPRLSQSVRAAGLREGTRELADTVRFARAEAMRRRLKTRLNMNANGMEYWLTVQDADAEYTEQFGGFEDAFLDEKRRLPEGVHIKRVLEGDRAFQGGAITFRPDGVSAPHTILLTDRFERNRAIEIGVWWDDVTTSTGEGEAHAEDPA